MGCDPWGRRYQRGAEIVKLNEKQSVLNQIDAELYRRDMHKYMREVAWPVVEPGVEFVDNWHLHAICEHLQAVLDGEIKNLLVNMPPRFAKSLLISVTFPTFAWIRDPHLRFIFASYSAALATRDAVKSRRVISSPRFQQLFGDTFQLVGDQNEKTRYENSQTGVRLTTSVAGVATGEGGDILVCDDPHNVLEGESEQVREEAWKWWSETMSTRLNNLKTGHKIVVMQRVHEMDVSGHILEQGGYEHLCIPMRYEEKTPCVTVLGRPDPRTVEGELAWPARYDEEGTESLEKSMGPYAVAGQLQQRPAPREGALIPVEKLQYVDVEPSNLVYVRGWDLAATEAQVGSNPAYTAGVRLGKDPRGRFYVCGVRRGQWSAANVREQIKQTAQQDGTHVRVRLPQDPGQAGKSQAQDLTAMLAGWVVSAVPESGSKVQRAEPFAAQVEAGNVFIVRGTWNDAYVNELRTFPAGRFKDQVDATSSAFAELIPMPNSAGVALDYVKNRVAAQNADKQRQTASRDRIEGAANVIQLASMTTRAA